MTLQCRLRLETFQDLCNMRWIDRLHFALIWVLQDYENTAGSAYCSLHINICTCSELQNNWNLGPHTIMTGKILWFRRFANHLSWALNFHRLIYSIIYFLDSAFLQLRMGWCPLVCGDVRVLKSMCMLFTCVGVSRVYLRACTPRKNVEFRSERLKCELTIGKEEREE